MLKMKIKKSHRAYELPNPVDGQNFCYPTRGEFVPQGECFPPDDVLRS